VVFWEHYHYNDLLVGQIFILNYAVWMLFVFKDDFFSNLSDLIPRKNSNFNKYFVMLDVRVVLTCYKIENEIINYIKLDIYTLVWSIDVSDFGNT
jgi:hypothetical protein